MSIYTDDGREFSRAEILRDALHEPSIRCGCGDCFVCTWLAGNPDPFGVAEPTPEELRQEAVDAEDDRRAERYEWE